MAILLAAWIPVKTAFNPESVVGHRVRLKTLLSRRLDLPEGVIARILSDVPRHGGVVYLIALDSEVTFEPRRSRMLLRHRPKVTVSHVILHMRNSDEIEAELHGEVRSELTAPLLFYSTRERALPPNKLGSEGDLDVIGPVQVWLA